jgi:hypothetical protein
LSSSCKSVGHEPFEEDGIKVRAGEINCCSMSCGARADDDLMIKYDVSGCKLGASTRNGASIIVSSPVALARGSRIDAMARGRGGKDL